MKKTVVTVTFLLAVLAVVKGILPDVQRYVRIRNM
ncbi:DUF6893 family small protein [Streptomyces sp. NPDC048718]